MKTCRECIQWENAGGGWGYCTLINENSMYIDANLSIMGLEKFGEIRYEAQALLETRETFGCNKIMVEE